MRNRIIALVIATFALGLPVAAAVAPAAAASPVAAVHTTWFHT